MKSVFEKILVVANRHLPTLFSLVVATLFFLVISGYTITEKSMIAKLLTTGAGFFGGMIGGGVLGWIVGGFGLVAMGTGVGVGALGAIVIGATVGAVFGGLTGASFSFVQMLRNPADYDVNWIALVMVFFGSVAVFYAVRWALRKVPKLVRGLGIGKA